MAIPKELEQWVAKDGQQATTITHPCYIDYSAVEELAIYHPNAIEAKNYAFKHVADADAAGPYAKVESHSNDWNGKMKTVLLALKLRPQQVNGIDVLIDEAIKNIETPEMHGWKVTRWLVAKGLDTNLSPVHHDFITWKKGGAEVQSMFSWRPYLDDPAQPAAKSVLVNDRSLRLYINRW